MIFTSYPYIDYIIITMVLFYVLMIANKMRMMMDKKPFLGIDGMMILGTIIVITSAGTVMYKYEDPTITQSSHNHDHHNAHAIGAAIGKDIGSKIQPSHNHHEKN